MAESESTFSDLKNLDGQGLRFRVDESWRMPAGDATLTPVGGQLVYLSPIQPEQILPPEQRPVGGQSEGSLAASAFHSNSSAGNVTPDGDELLSQPLASPSTSFIEFFTLGGRDSGVRSPGGLTTSDFRSFPGQWADHVTAGPEGAEQFITSDNCLGCHGGLGGAPYGVSMFVQTGPNYGDGYNISPFGEWRWSPMGLAGRDPIFYSQLATEKAILDRNFKEDPSRFNNDPAMLEDIKTALGDTCLSCHGAMGQRQLLIDHAAGPGSSGEAPPDPNFKTEYVYLHTAMTEADLEQKNYEYHKYGNLAREGISCAVCHHVDPPTQWQEGMSELEKEELFLVHSTTGQFPYSPPDELNGPFEDVLELPMMQALRIRPEHNAYIQDSRMCGTCHTINLPNVDCGWQSVTDSAKSCDGDDCAKRCQPMPVLDESARLQARAIKEQYGVDYAELLANNFPHSIEQATYLEWKNSSFADPQSADFQSCQDCHMPRAFKSLDGSIDIEPLHSQIATIQDSNYPEVENGLSNADIDVPVRSDYRRHELVGLNVFLVEMFDQFDPILGIDETDYMTSATTGDKLAIENMVLQGREKTATIDVSIQKAEGEDLIADVSITSLTGHRFPSGVGFRRAWIELQVLDQTGERVWASGLTNDVGLIVGPDGQPLPTEFFEGDQWQRWQPHFHGIPDASCRPCKTAVGAAGCRRDHACADMPPPITRQDQVQIYEEVTLNGQDEVTYSFIHRDEHPKDNRFLPRGWRPSEDFTGEILQQFMEATNPEGVGADPDYTEGQTGQDRVRYEISLPPGVDASKVTVAASLYSQSLQPYWFKRKFELSGNSDATKRLYYLASHLNTQGTVIDDWKLRLVTCTKSADGQVTGPGCAANPSNSAPMQMARAH